MFFVCSKKVPPEQNMSTSGGPQAFVPASPQKHFYLPHCSRWALEMAARARSDPQERSKWLLEPARSRNGARNGRSVIIIFYSKTGLSRFNRIPVGMPKGRRKEKEGVGGREPPPCKWEGLGGRGCAPQDWKSIRNEIELNSK